MATGRIYDVGGPDWTDLPPARKGETATSYADRLVRHATATLSRCASDYGAAEDAEAVEVEVEVEANVGIIARDADGSVVRYVALVSDDPDFESDEYESEEYESEEDESNDSPWRRG